MTILALLRRKPAPTAAIVPPVGRPGIAVDLLTLWSGGGIRTHYWPTRRGAGEASAARSFLVGAAFGGVGVFAVIVWATIGKVGVN